MLSGYKWLIDAHRPADDRWLAGVGGWPSVTVSSN
jgi:hypothetical protein